MTESDTPITDAATHDDWSGGASAVEVETSQQLERSLTAAHATIKRLTEDLRIMKSQYEEERDAHLGMITARDIAKKERDAIALDRDAWKSSEAACDRQFTLLDREVNELRVKLSAALARVEETKDDAALLDALEEWNSKPPGVIICRTFTNDGPRYTIQSAEPIVPGGTIHISLGDEKKTLREAIKSAIKEAAAMTQA